MGKNQAYKAMQRARLGSGSAAAEEVDDGMMDGSFHSPEWHAARLASLKTSHTVTWEEFKKKQKEEEMRKGELEADKDRMMREYRAQLDAERASKLAKGKNHLTGKGRRKKDNDKDARKRSGKRRKHSRRSSDSDATSSESSSSDDDEDDDSDGEKALRKSKSKSRKRKRERKHKSASRSKHSGSSDEEAAGGPLPLSSFFGSAKS